MTPDPWMAMGISGAAAFFTGIAAIFTGLSAWQTGRTAKAAVDQVELQRQIQIDAAQPYVWADIGEHPTKQGLIALWIKCEGPTAARNVRLTCDRSLPSDEQLATWAEKAQHAMEEGTSYLAPGRDLIWSLGVGHRVLREGADFRYRCSLSYDGPYGPVGPIDFVIDLGDWRTSHPNPPGSLNEIRLAIRDLTKAIEKG